MTEKKKSRYTESQKRSAEKYLQGFENVMFRVPKGQRKVIQDYARSRGESVNSFIARSISEQMQRDQQERDQKTDQDSPDSQD